MSTPKCMSDAFMPFRAMVFVLVCVCATVPFFIFCANNGFVPYFTDNFIIAIVLYFLGAAFYALKFPERFFPGKFDFWVRCFKFFLTLSPFSFKGTQFSTSSRPQLLSFTFFVHTTYAAGLSSQVLAD
jgi:hypothetical protein